MINCYCKNCNQYFQPNGITGADSTCPYCGERATIHSELFWCEHCNIPIYDEVCPICGKKGEKFTSDARPVFPEERLLLEILLGKPLAFINGSVWNGVGNKYYVNGKRINFSVASAAKKDAALIRAELEKYSVYNNYSTFNSIIQLWVKANMERYHHINDEARAFIQNKASEFENQETCATFVSFSGGKDSTVVSDLVRKALSKPDVIHIFGNTTLEFPETYEYIQRFKKQNPKTPVLRAENKEQDFYNLCETFGPPSRSLRW